MCRKVPFRCTKNTDHRCAEFRPPPPRCADFVFGSPTSVPDPWRRIRPTGQEDKTYPSECAICLGSWEKDDVIKATSSIGRGPVARESGPWFGSRAEGLGPFVPLWSPIIWEAILCGVLGL